MSGTAHVLDSPFHSRPLNECERLVDEHHLEGYPRRLILLEAGADYFRFRLLGCHTPLVDSQNGPA